MSPRASGSHQGLPKPEKAGTITTPPLFGQVVANCSSSEESFIIPSSSRRHWTVAPVEKIEPSSAYVRGDSESNCQATVVKSPS